MSFTLDNIPSMDTYLGRYGKELGKIAMNALDPLHIPGRDPLPDFDCYPAGRRPFDPQANMIVATAKMLDEQGSGFDVAEMGAGKTIMAMLAIDTHANKRHIHPTRERGHGYYCIVLCPDHLISKWRQEIETTITDAHVVTFEKSRKDPEWQQAFRYFNSLRMPQRVGVEMKHGARWKKADHPTFIVLGRDQVKHMPPWLRLNESTEGYAKDGNSGHGKGIATKLQAIRRPKYDENNMPVRDAAGRQKIEHELLRLPCCPKCGGVPRDKHGNPMSQKDLDKNQVRCTTRLLREVPKEGRKVQGLDRYTPGTAARLYSEYTNLPVGKKVERAGTQYVVEECGERLSQWTGKSSRRWSIAKFIHTKCRGLIDYMIVDEVHEQKGDESAQGTSCARIMAASRHVLALTGTLIGGYADHLFPLMFRMVPRGLVEEGFEWGKDMEFSQKYGRVDTIITAREPGEVQVRKNVRSARRARTGSRSVRKNVKPGIMPQLFGRHLIGTAAFLTLREMSDELPEMDEVPIGVDMNVLQQASYDIVHSELESKSREMLAQGSMKLLGTYLRTTLDYPDRPFGWTRPYPEKKAVGYYQQPKDFRVENYVGVVDPPELPEDYIYPKEQELLDICKRHTQKGEQVWVYVEMSGKRNIMDRLASILEKNGIKAGVLKRDTVERRDRHQWIEDNGKKYQVIISNPTLVSTGLDLFSKKKGGHNFNILVFYQTGYDTFKLRQAARRAWRIAQPKDCMVYYLFYKGTMQEQAMNLMADKMVSSTALEGQFSTEGLLAMAGDESQAQVAMARAVNSKLDDDDLARKWSKIKSNEDAGRTRKPRRDPNTIITIEGPDEFDDTVNDELLDRLGIEGSDDEEFDDETDAALDELYGNDQPDDEADEDDDVGIASRANEKFGKGGTDTKKDAVSTPLGPIIIKPIYGDGAETRIYPRAEAEAPAPEPDDEPEPDRCDSCAVEVGPEAHDPEGPTLCPDCGPEPEEEAEPTDLEARLDEAFAAADARDAGFSPPAEPSSEPEPEPIEVPDVREPEPTDDEVADALADAIVEEIAKPTPPPAMSSGLLSDLADLGIDF